MRGMRTSAILAAAIGLVVLQGAKAEDRDAAIFDGLCNRCHGAQGQGVRGLKAPLIAGMPAWYIERQLHNFRERIRGAHPRDMPGMRMRPMARTLRESDVPIISAYVAGMPAQQAAPTLEGADIGKGKASFTLCATCHGADGKGNQQMGAPMLAGQSDWYLLTQLKNFKKGIRGSDPGDAFGAQMRGMVAALDEEDMKNIVTYIQSLPEK